MRAMIIVGIVLGFCAGQTATAGAWLRDHQSGFLSLSFGATQTDQTTNALYLEYGLTQQTTLGVDVSAFSIGSDVRNAFGIVFMRRALGDRKRPSKWAYEIGIGALWDQDRTLPAVKTSLSWGRGFQLGDRSGRISVDAGYVHEPTLQNHTTKLDATAGLGFTQITTGILEMTYSHKDTDCFGAV